MEKISQTHHTMKTQYFNDYLYKFKIQHLVKYIQSEVQQGTSVLTLCLPPSVGSIQRALDLTQNKNVNSKNIKQKKNRESVQDITQKLIKYLQSKNEKQFIQTLGLVIYVGVFGRSGSVQLIDIQPTVKIGSFLYSCEFQANTSFLDDMIRPKTNNLYAVVDGLGVKIFTELMGKVTKEHDQDYQAIRKHHKGGQSSNRFMHITQDTRHQQVKNSADQIIKVIRIKKIQFDSVYICGAESFKKEIINGIKESDISLQVHKYYDISLPSSCQQIDNLFELKQQIADFDEFVIQDEMTKEKRQFAQFHETMRVNDELCQFGIQRIFKDISASNVNQIFINDDFGDILTAQEVQNFGIDVQDIFGDRDYMEVIQVLLELKLRNLHQFELIIFQSSHMKHELQQLGGLSAILHYKHDDYFE